MGATKTRHMREQSNPNGNEEMPKVISVLGDFQDCIDACTFGKFHYVLIIISFFLSIASTISMSNFPYILPNAECDLHMTIYHKGVLNAAPYIGMLCSGFFAGFLVDTFGRKKILLLCLYGMFISICVQGTSQTYIILAVAKATEGFLFNGVSCSSITLISEFTTSKTRDRIMLLNSSFKSICNIILALLAWGILPRDWNVILFGGAIRLHSWNFFLYMGGIFNLIAVTLFLQIPESPKYHFAHGRYEEAFSTLKKMYVMNTGKPFHTFPYHPPNQEPIDIKEQKKPFMQTMQYNFQSTKILFRKPLLSYLLIMICVDSMLLMVFNTMRLWYPQISTILETHKPVSNETATICTTLDDYMRTANDALRESTVEGTQECIPNKSGSETYINAIIMGAVCCVPYFITGVIINVVGKRILIVTSMIGCGCICAALYWASSSLEVAMLFSAFVALSQVSLSILIIITVEIFPTVVKSFAVSLVAMCGRITTLIGTIIFPVLLAQGCVVPFISISAVVTCVAVLAVFLPVGRIKGKINS